MAATSENGEVHKLPGLKAWVVEPLHHPSDASNSMVSSSYRRNICELIKLPIVLAWA